MQAVLLDKRVALAWITGHLRPENSFFFLSPLVLNNFFFSFLFFVLYPVKCFPTLGLFLRGDWWGILELCLLSYQATSFSILELLHPWKSSRENKLVILANMDMAYVSGGNSGNTADTGIPPTKGLVNLTKPSRVHPVESCECCPFLKEKLFGHWVPAEFSFLCSRQTLEKLMQKWDLLDPFASDFLLLWAHLLLSLPSKPLAVLRSSVCDFGMWKSTRRWHKL